MPERSSDRVSLANVPARVRTLRYCAESIEPTQYGFAGCLRELADELETALSSNQTDHPHQGGSDDALENDEAASASGAGAASELQDALDDAIRRAYREPIQPPVEGEDPDTVRSLAISALVSDPNRLRHLAALQKAAWDTIAPYLPVPSDHPQEPSSAVSQFCGTEHHGLCPGCPCSCHLETQQGKEGCSACDGRGTIPVHLFGPASDVVPATCQSCNGTGKKPATQHPDGEGRS